MQRGTDEPEYVLGRFGLANEGDFVWNVSLIEAGRVIDSSGGEWRGEV